MSIATTIPISISAEAGKRVAELGMQHELERILEYTCQAPGVHRIDVTLIPPCDPGDDPRVVLEVSQDLPEEANNPLWRQWCDWMVDTFPSDVLRHFNLLSVHGASDEG
jgi:hypothetical protein